MGKRRITKRQANRIHNRQAAQINKQASDEGKNGLVISQHGVHVDVEDAEGQVWQLKRRQHLGAIVAGDHVIWEQHGESGVVTAIHPRTSLLSRPNARGQVCAVAANITQMFIVIATHPQPSSTTIDRYLAAAELSNIQPIIFFNKYDLIDQYPQTEFIEKLKIYEQLDIPVKKITALDPNIGDEISSSFVDQTSVLVGQSGVGKSSIIAALLPDEDLRVGEVSEKKHGRHTTTQAHLYHLPNKKGNIIDSPGIRQFPLWPMSPSELAQGFKEFLPFVSQCKFRNCRHKDDPGCKLQEACQQGAIAKFRLENYQKIIKQLAD